MTFDFELTLIPFYGNEGGRGVQAASYNPPWNIQSELTHCVSKGILVWAGSSEYLNMLCLLFL